VRPNLNNPEHANPIKPKQAEFVPIWNLAATCQVLMLIIVGQCARLTAHLCRAPGAKGLAWLLFVVTRMAAYGW